MILVGRFGLGLQRGAEIPKSADQVLDGFGYLLGIVGRQQGHASAQIGNRLFKVGQVDLIALIDQIVATFDKFRQIVDFIEVVLTRSAFCGTIHWAFIVIRRF